MAWTAPVTWAANQVLTAAQLNTHLRDNFLELEPAKIVNAGDYIVSTGANSLAARQYDFARDNTSGTRVSSAYGDLASVGPAVTLTTTTRAIVFFGARMFENAAENQTKVSYAVSGATTSAASDTRALLIDGTTAGNACHIYHSDFRSDLTAGSNTFTLKYASDGANTSTYEHRWIAVMGL